MLWASTSNKRPGARDTRYVEELIGADTVTTLPEATVTAFEDHGALSRTVDTDLPRASEVMSRLVALGIDLDDVGRALEVNGLAVFDAAYDDVLAGPSELAGVAATWAVRR
ncbi:transaldolase family protein [Kribbella sp. NPDC002412]